MFPQRLHSLLLPNTGLRHDQLNIFGLNPLIVNLLAIIIVVILIRLLAIVGFNSFAFSRMIV